VSSKPQARVNRVPRVYFSGIVSVNYQGKAAIVPAGWYEKVAPNTYRKAAR
jgi:hypothetical protein